MNRFVVAFFGIFLALSDVLGNEFLKAKLPVIGIRPMEGAAILLAGTMLWPAMRDGRRISGLRSRAPWERACFGFMAFSMFAVVLSYLRFFRLLPAATALPFDSAWIPRQAYFLVFGPIFAAYTMTVIARGKFSYLTRVYLMAVLICICVGFIASGAFLCGTWWPYLIPFALRGTRFKSWQSVLTTCFFALLIGRLGGSMSRTLAASLFCVTLGASRFVGTVFSRPLIPALFASGVAAMMAFLTPVLKWLDANTWWRLSYWWENLTELYRSYGIGVGFGTVYAPFSFTDRISFGILPGVDAREILFSTAQHSSFVNLFFRTGIIGGGLFVAFHFLLWKSAGEALERKSCDSAMVAASLGFQLAATVMIMLNVGLESPRFMIPFAVATGTLMAAVQEVKGMVRLDV